MSPSRLLRALLLFLTLGLVVGALTAAPASAATSGTITGTITGPNGQAIRADVEIYQYYEWDDFDEGWDSVDDVRASSTGAYTFSNLELDGVYRLCADIWDRDDLAQTCFGGGTIVDEAGDITFSTGQTSRQVNLQLQAAGTIVGQVKGPDGRPLSEGSAFLFRQSGGQFYQASDASIIDGEYTATKLTPGDWRICFEGELGTERLAGECWNDKPWTPEDADPVMVTAGGTAEANAQLARGSKIVGKVLDTKKKPIKEDVYVTVHHRVLNGWGEAGFAEVDPRTGSYTVSGLAAGTYRVSFEPAGRWDDDAEDYLPSAYAMEYWNDKPTLDQGNDVVVAAQSTKTVDGTLDPAATISGRLSGVDPDDYGYVTLYAESVDGGWYEEDYTDVDSRGDYTFHGLAPGAYRLGFAAEDEEGDDVGLQSEFWNDRRTIESADDVVVTKGQKRTGVNATLTADGPPPAKVTTTTTPTISSSKPQVGVALKATPGTWQPSRTTFTYQWRTADGDIAGATGQSFTPTADQLAKKLQVVVTGSAPGYEESFSKASAFTSSATVAGSLTAPTPKIDQTKPKVDQRLTAVPGTWTSGTDLTYQWQVNGKNVTGATEATYDVLPADLGKYVTVVVKGTQTGYGTVSKTSSKTSKVAAASLTPTPVPTIDDTTPTAGQTLTADASTWGPGDVTKKYQWLANGKTIKGATESTYVVRGSYAKQKLSVSVSGSKPGYSTVTKTSAQTTAVVAGTLAPQVPVVSGDLAVGRTLTAGSTDWTSIPGETTVKYEWLRDGAVISKATGKTYTLTAADLGKVVTVRVAGSASGYTALPADQAKRTSTASDPVAPGTLAVSKDPSISVPKNADRSQLPTGSKLTASAGTWGPKGVKLTYRWFRGDTEITSLRGKTSYTTTTADAATQLRFVVTGTLSGYTTLERSVSVSTVGYALG